MTKKPFSHDATPDVHAFSSPPENAGELINMYGTYNIQRTADTENTFPLVTHALPARWRGMRLGKRELEALDEQRHE